MTNKEAIAAICNPYPVEGAAMDLHLLDAGLAAGDEYTTGNKPVVYTAAYGVLQSLLSIASISEGGYSISFKAEQLKSKMVTVAYTSGKQALIDEAKALQPKVTSRKAW